MQTPRHAGLKPEGAPALTGRPLLLHVCCAPCMTVVQEGLRNEEYEVTAFFRNPNIHPWKEMRHRLDAAASYCAELDLPLEIDDAYPLEEYLSMLIKATDRCRACFEERLSATARRAAESGMGAFSTTLSVSPYQDQQAIIAVGEAAASKYGVEFVYRDFRPLYRESVNLSREAGMYRQKYCGCIFSKRDRYLGTCT